MALCSSASRSYRARERWNIGLVLRNASGLTGWAVRQGPLLAKNLAAALEGQHLINFVPQRHALALLADGKGGALMSWAGITAEGRLFGWWKDRLDQKFINKLTIM